MNKIITIIALLISLSSYSQFNNLFDNESRDNGYKYFAGGSAGLSLGSVTNVTFRPSVGYKVYPNLHAGISFYFNYYKNNYYIPPYIYKTYGGSVFGRYFFVNTFFVQTEYERIFFNDPNYSGQLPDIRLDKANVGIGYRSWGSDRSYFLITLLWNTFDKEFNFGINPFLRGGFIFEF